MNEIRRTKFLQAVLPVLQQLDKEWFHPGKKSPEGYYYACGYCDTECGGHERHDPDCLSELGKQTLEEFTRIDQNKEYDFHKVGRDAGHPREPEDAASLRDFFKDRAVIKILYSTDLGQLIPLDHKDPANKSTVCQCYIRVVSKKYFNEHHEACVIKKLADALADRIKL